METIETPEPNKTIARLHMSLSNCSLKKAKNHLKKKLIQNDTLPTGATVLKGTGYWIPTDDDGNILHDKKEVEDNIVIELWLESETELLAVKHLKEHLETRFKQDSIPLTLEDRYCEY